MKTAEALPAGVPGPGGLRPDLRHFIIGHLLNVAPLADCFCGALDLDF